MPSSTAPRPATLMATLAACAVLAAGAGGLALWHSQFPATARTTGPLLLAPMIGVIDSCVLEPSATAAPSPSDLRASCSGPEGSAAALLKATLSPLQPQGRAAAAYTLGYTLPVPLLQLFRHSPEGWVIDQDTVGRLVRTVRDNSRPLILYLFSTHFATDAPLEKELALNPANLAQTRDGPLAQSRYYDSAINNWSLASTQTELTARRVQAAQAVLEAICRLPAPDIAKIKGVTLLGELHHLFPNFEAGMGFDAPYRVTDYSPASVAGFQQFLRQQFAGIEQLNRVLGADYAAFDAVQPPSRDIRTEPLQRFTEHIDSFAHGSLPISGWAYVKPTRGAAPAWVHIYRNGVFVGKTPVNQGRQDVLAAKPELGDANTGWRLDMDFRHLPVGQYRIDAFLEATPGRLTHLGTRHIALMGRDQSAPPLLPQQALPASAAADAAQQAHIDLPAEQSSYYYNPLVPLWHRFRQQQVVDYLQFFNGVVNQSCLADTPHYTHQIIPFSNPSWDANKYAIQASLQPMKNIRLGVSLYGNAAYGEVFSRWYGGSGHAGYGVTEFHPLKAMDAPAVQHMLGQHAQRGAQFVSFFLEPRWQGALVQRGHNTFSLDPENAQFGAAALYQSVQQVLTAPATAP
ncbi:hypothetical protein [Simplicispira psychrophila]|uniref:hypothetical protein n=1 Tax=Simplicispira psychrophila TaxID=80882 RepID=UPI00068F484C|nr:hypothetical protein [Simplicispira psychrophila]